MAARLFVGVYPPVEVRAGIEAAVPRPAAPGVRWVPPVQWHVTLRFLGLAEEDDVAAALASVDLPGATAVIGPAVSRLGRSVIVVPVGGLESLAAAVVAATSDLGRPPEPREFHGHLTLGRLKGRSPVGVMGTAVSGRFPVREVELVSSRTLSSGAEHEVLARFPVGS